MTMNSALHRIAMPGMLALIGALLAGCPYLPDGTITTTDDEYELGFEDGFAEDGEYWQGYDDSMATVDFGPIYYQGSSIPIVDSPDYDAGYWDGVWYAYNDGYFVSYDYAFTIGFSEGYDVAFNADWPTVFAADEHVEYADGGFSDGYNDGFSEGLVFGAWDYENGWGYDWEDAMWDYRDGTDLEIGDTGTGLYGPVYLYEYGVDPMDLLKSARRINPDHATPSIRQGAAKTELPNLSYRSLTSSAEEAMIITPESSLRGGYSLSLETSWLDRINAYQAAFSTGKSAHQSRRTTSTP